MSRITVGEFEEIVRESLPFAQSLGAVIVELGPERTVLRMPYRDDFLRPGGSISGPLPMGLADVAMYAMVLASVGRVELAVTTSLTINFLRKPPPATHRRGALAEARQAAGRGRGGAVFRRRSADGGACHRHLFHPARA
jgi:acyl-coenzyme A thioesterase PaaI-like protein